MPKTKKFTVVVASFQGLVEMVYVIGDDDEETKNNLILDVQESGRSINVFPGAKLWDMKEYNK